jgi:hypothetical protein
MNQQVIRAHGYTVKVNEDIAFMWGHFFTVPLISNIALSQNVHKLQEIKKYRATVKPAVCGRILAWYISADDCHGTIAYYNPDKKKVRLS